MGYQEIEARWRLDGETAEKLRASFFLSAKKYREETSVLRGPNSTLRLRKRFDDSRNWHTVEFTVKGADTSKSSVVRVRSEHTLTVHPAPASFFENTKHFLEALGFKEVFRYDKDVREALLATRRGRQVKLFLTHLPFLGWRLEIEGQSSHAVLGVARRIGMRREDAEKTSYEELARQYFAAQRLPMQNLIFKEVKR